MKYILPLMVLVLTAISCGPPNGQAPSSPVKEFEGVITYKISYVNKPDSEGEADTMWLTYSKGSIVREFNPKGEKKLKKDLFLTRSNEYYGILTGQDTMYTFDLRSDVMEMTNSEHSVTPVRILGYPCEKLKFDQEYKGNVRFKDYSIFFYNEDTLKVDKKYFSNWHYGNFDKYIERAGCLYLRCELDMQLPGREELSRSIYEAVDIKEQPVDPKVFLIDKANVKKIEL